MIKMTAFMYLGHILPEGVKGSVLWGCVRQWVGV